MKAIAVYPGKPGSMHLEEVPMPSVTDIPEGRGVLVQVLRVGVDGTDKEVNAAEYGQAPQGSDYLITGHENFGRVVEVGPQVPDTIRPGTYVVATMRRPGHSIYDAAVWLPSVVLEIVAGIIIGPLAALTLLRGAVAPAAAISPPVPLVAR